MASLEVNRKVMTVYLGDCKTCIFACYQSFSLFRCVWPVCLSGCFVSLLSKFLFFMPGSLNVSWLPVNLFV